MHVTLKPQSESWDGSETRRGDLGGADFSVHVSDDVIWWKPEILRARRDESEHERSASRFVAVLVNQFRRLHCFRQLTVLRRHRRLACMHPSKGTSGGEKSQVAQLNSPSRWARPSRPLPAEKDDLETDGSGRVRNYRVRYTCMDSSSSPWDHVSRPWWDVVSHELVVSRASSSKFQWQCQPCWRTFNPTHRPGCSQGLVPDPRVLRTVLYRRIHALALYMSTRPAVHRCLQLRTVPL